MDDKGKTTSTRTITRLGVLTVIAGNSKDSATRKKARAGIKEIVGGKTHVPQWKVRDRSAERCVIGGACVGYEVGGVAVIVTGTN